MNLNCSKLSEEKVGRSIVRKLWPITFAVSISFLLPSTVVRAQIKIQTIDYKIGNEEFEGYLAFDSNKPGNQPVW